MGTNYYYYTPDGPVCPTCGRCDEAEVRHIGKSSGGWVFALHVYPDEGICDLDDWRRLFAVPGTWIEDEYGSDVAPDYMLEIITERQGPAASVMGDDGLAANRAVRGPHNLARARVDGTHCIGHGEGTWDLHVGEFS